MKPQQPHGVAGGDMVDCGALCLPGLADKVHALVEDARSKGARIVAGGVLPGNALGQFYPPTVIAGVTTEMRIWREETFGPVMVITPFVRDADAVRCCRCVCCHVGPVVKRWVQMDLAKHALVCATRMQCSAADGWSYRNRG